MPSPSTRGAPMSRALARSVAVGLALWAAFTIGAAAADDAPPLVLADFEGAKAANSVKAGRGTAEIVADGASGHALHWVVEPAEQQAPHVHIRVPSGPDLAKYSYVQFRIRRDGKRAGPMHFRIENDPERYLGSRVRGVTEEWQTMAIDLDGMEMKGSLDAPTARILAFVINGSTGGSYLIDDIALVAAAPDARPADAKGGAGRRLVADFEAEESIEFVDPMQAKVERVAAGKGEKGSVLAITPDPGAATSSAELFGGPADIRGYGKLRFRVRATKPVKPTMHVRFETTVDDNLGAKVTGISTQWKTVELKIPEMVEFQAFDPRHVQSIGFMFFEAPNAVVQIDDVELEESPNGWRGTEAELLARAFGDARAKKATKEETAHFLVYSDSAAVQGGFPAALEEHYAFVMKALALKEVDEKLPVYVFQNSTLYTDFCVRFLGTTKTSAEESHGKAGARYFATYYQSSDAATVVHELTHSLFQRSSGVWGGSWFQEGVAVYVEHLFKKESAAELFAPALRAGQFVHLVDFMKMTRLAAEHDVKGGADTSARLYLQAGAFHEFLRRGPMADKAPAFFAALSRARSASQDESPARVAALLGRSIDEIEKDWVAWGSDPPKEK